MSLRAFHIFFVVVAVIAADVFGVWAVRDYMNDGDLQNLALGIVTLLGGLALVLYGIWFVRKTEQSGIR